MNTTPSALEGKQTFWKAKVGKECQAWRGGNLTLGNEITASARDRLLGNKLPGGSHLVGLISALCLSSTFNLNRRKRIPRTGLSSEEKGSIRRQS